MNEKVQKLVEFVSSGLSIDEVRDLGLCLLLKAISLKVEELEKEGKL